MRALALILATLFSFHAFALPAAGNGGMVVTAHPDATSAGAAMLERGGNAVDAAVAAAFALAVSEPYSSGIGGGGFALVRMGEELRFVDFREVAPAAAHRDMFLRDGEVDPSLSRDGALAVGVPGAVAGYLELHRRWGKLDREAVLEPAIRLAEEGFVVQSRYRVFTSFRRQALLRDPEAARIFLAEDGSIPALGSRIVQPQLAATLRAIAKEGADAFYEGPIAERLVDDLRRRGGILSLEDLSSYRVRDREPLVGRYLGHAVATAPPPSAGGAVVLTALNFLETLPEGTPWRDPLALHVMLEGFKQAFSDRVLFGDPDFVDIPVDELVSKERARRLAANLPWQANPAEDVAPAWSGDDSPEESPFGMHTTHLSVVDESGNAVSLTSTINTPFGAAIVAQGTGVLLNNEMDDFATAPGVPNAYGVVGSEANAVAPGKVPLSSMSPTIVFAGPSTKDPVRLVVGSPGGPRIPTTVVQVIYNHLALGAPVDRAVSLGRIHQQHRPDWVFYEPFALDAATLGLLRARGHRLRESPPWSNATVIAIDPKTGLRTGAADPRGIGTAIAVGSGAARVDRQGEEGPTTPKRHVPSSAAEPEAAPP